MNAVSIKIKNCLDCPFHKIEPDPDPHDWFNRDDEKVVCTKVQRNITSACRPHQTRKESSIPTWCPLKKKSKTKSKSKIKSKTKVKI